MQPSCLVIVLHLVRPPWTCRWYELVLEAQDDIATIMTVESGKPLAESKSECLSGCAAAMEATHLTVTLSPTLTLKVHVRMQPNTVCFACNHLGPCRSVH